MFATRSLTLLFALLLIGLSSCGRSSSQPIATQNGLNEKASVVEQRAETKPVDPSNAFFDNGLVPTIRIHVKKSVEQKWREDIRRYVKCSVTESLPDPDKPDSRIETTYTEVAIKVKGAAGSSRKLDDKPAFTLNVSKHSKGQTFHGMEKFHLNNSVQDESYLNEWLCADIARDMKVPATRVTHARVLLNDRDLGLYVLKEGFDRPFSREHFGDADGNLYDGGFLQDVDVDLEKDSGKGPDDHSDLHALKAACAEPDPATRWSAIEQHLNLDAFLTFVAFEAMTCHWDGYTPNKNNYRIYFHPKDGRARFLPHGMDQMFGDAGFPIFEYPPTIVAGAVMHNPKWRAPYKSIIESSLSHFDAARLQERLDIVSTRLQPVIKPLGQDFINAFNDRGREFRDRVTARCDAASSLRTRRTHADGVRWNQSGRHRRLVSAQETGDSQLEDLDSETDNRRYVIRVGESNDCVASWRRRVLLSKGRYRIEATLKTEGVEPRTDEKGSGAGVRISGGTRDNSLTGDNDWTTVSHEFDIPEDIRNTELVIELRATKGALLIRPVVKLSRALVNGQ